LLVQLVYPITPSSNSSGANFKIAVTGAEAGSGCDPRPIEQLVQVIAKTVWRAALRVLVGAAVWTHPMIGRSSVTFLPEADLLPFARDCQRSYNLLVGRRITSIRRASKITGAMSQEIERDIGACRGPNILLRRAVFTGVDQADCWPRSRQCSKP